MVQSIDVVQLIEGYKRRHGIDVSSLFEGISQMLLLHDSATGLSFFDPAVSGDSAFYAAIARALATTGRTRQSFGSPHTMSRAARACWKWAPE